MLDFESIVLIDRDTVSEANLGTRDVRRTGNSWTVFLQATFGPTTESDFVQKQVVVLVACDGNAALQLSRTHHGKIDVLLTDIEMPWMDGISAYLQIKAERPDIKVLFVSGAAKSFLLPEGLAF